MVEFTFIAEKNLLRVKVSGKRMFFVDYSPTGQLIIQEIDKALEHMTRKKISKEKQEELLEKIKKMKQLLKDMKSQKEVEEYVVSELKPLGFNLIKIQREGARPVFIKSSE